MYIFAPTCGEVQTPGTQSRIHINTGLQAGARQASASKAVSTAFLFPPVETVALDKFLELLCKRANPMMLLLSYDVRRDRTHVGF